MAQDDAAMVTEGVWRAVLACWDADGHLLSTEQRVRSLFGIVYLSEYPSQDCLMAVLQSVSALRDSLLFLPHLFHQHVIKVGSLSNVEVWKLYQELFSSSSCHRSHLR